MHLAMYFPGGYLPGQDPFNDPLAFVTISALEEAGSVVVRVRYDDHMLAQDLERYESGIRRDVHGALVYYQPDVVTLVGKSRGTHALRQVLVEEVELPDDSRLIWQTPVWRGTDGGRAWEAACSTPLASLYLVGLGDQQYHEPDRHQRVPGETVAIPEANHGLQVPGDVLATLDAWRTAADAIVRFASRR